MDKAIQDGTHWTCFMIKDNKYVVFGSFVGQLEKFPLQKLSKPIVYHNYIFQDLYSRLCVFFCLYFFYLIESMKFYDAISKVYFV